MQIKAHESFCEQLQAKVEQLRPLLAKISKREMVVEERIELEHLMQNPERLTARGPKAREDRKREEDMQRRVKGLEKMTKEVNSYTDKQKKKKYARLRMKIECVPERCTALTLSPCVVVVSNCKVGGVERQCAIPLCGKWETELTIM